MFIVFCMALCLVVSSSISAGNDAYDVQRGSDGRAQRVKAENIIPGLLPASGVVKWNRNRYEYFEGTHAPSLLNLLKGQRSPAFKLQGARKSASLHSDSVMHDKVNYLGAFAAAQKLWGPLESYEKAKQGTIQKARLWLVGLAICCVGQWLLYRMQAKIKKEKDTAYNALLLYLSSLSHSHPLYKKLLSGHQPDEFMCHARGFARSNTLPPHINKALVRYQALCRQQPSFTRRLLTHGCTIACLLGVLSSWQRFQAIEAYNQNVEKFFDIGAGHVLGGDPASSHGNGRRKK